MCDSTALTSACITTTYLTTFSLSQKETPCADLSLGKLPHLPTPGPPQTTFWPFRLANSGQGVQMGSCHMQSLVPDFSHLAQQHQASSSCEAFTGDPFQNCQITHHRVASAPHSCWWASGLFLLLDSYKHASMNHHAQALVWTHYHFPWLLRTAGILCKA